MLLQLYKKCKHMNNASITIWGKVPFSKAHGHHRRCHRIYFFHCPDSTFTSPVIWSHGKWQCLVLTQRGIAYDCGDKWNWSSARIFPERSRSKPVNEWYSFLTWNFSLADGPTRDQEEKTTVEDSTGQLRDEPQRILLIKWKRQYLYLLNQLHLCHSKKYFSIPMTVTIFQLPKWHLYHWCYTSHNVIIFFFQIPYVWKSWFHPTEKHLGTLQKKACYHFCCTVLEYCKLYRPFRVDVAAVPSAARSGAQKGSVSRNSDPNLVASSYTWSGAKQTALLSLSTSQLYLSLSGPNCCTTTGRIR